MNSLRIAIVKLDPSNCQSHEEYPFALMVSQDNLIWWPINRFKTVDDALAQGRAFETFTKTNQLVKADGAPIWSTKS